MTIDWAHSPERREFVRIRWDAGLSTSEIARQCTSEWHEEVKKNAIVGCKRRSGWDDRPSPILRDRPPRSPATAVRRVCLPPGGNILPELNSLRAAVRVDLPDDPKVAPIPQSTRCLRTEGAPLYRRDGSGCLALGCDRPLYSLSKPYCRKCADNFYLKTKRPEAVNLAGDNNYADDDE